jgi:hypothetical protein
VESHSSDAYDDLCEKVIVAAPRVTGLAILSGRPSQMASPTI